MQESYFAQATAETPEKPSTCGGASDFGVRQSHSHRPKSCRVKKDLYEYQLRSNIGDNGHQQHTSTRPVIYLLDSLLCCRHIAIMVAHLLQRKSNPDKPSDLSFRTATTVSDSFRTEIQSASGNSGPAVDPRYKYHFKVLKKILRKVVARRSINNEQSKSIPRKLELQLGIDASERHAMLEVIPLRPYDPMICYLRNVTRVTSLEGAAEAQLAIFIAEIAELYNNDNQFHSFEHATNVMKAVESLFDTINAQQHRETCEEMHNRTYGIAFDPLVHFTCLLAALVHDADHPSVPNKQFMEENPDLAEKYLRQSAAEKVSFDHAWDLLMQDRFSALRSSIYGDVEEFQRFRNLLVNAVMGTDAFDAKLVKLRNERWTKAFRLERMTNPKRSMDRKATIVVHYLLLAADVSHTMSDWITYCRWNEKLFFEMTSAWQYGRSNDEPALGWYQGEIGFFDGWVIPLATQLQGLGIFGSQGEQNIANAKENRRRWEEEGKCVVHAMESAFENEQ